MAGRISRPLGRFAHAAVPRPARFITGSGLARRRTRTPTGRRATGTTGAPAAAQAASVAAASAVALSAAVLSAGVLSAVVLSVGVLPVGPPASPAAAPSGRAGVGTPPGAAGLVG